MKRSRSPRLRAYAALGGLGFLAALISGRPELAALGAPFLVVVGVGLAFAREPELHVEVELEHDRVIQGEAFEATVHVQAETPIEQLELLITLPQGIVPAEGRAPLVLRLGAGETQTHTLRLVAERWGAFELGDVLVRARDVFGLFAYDGRPSRATYTLRVYPREEALRTLLQPAETQAYAGDELARRTGEGIEFADLRPFVLGDQMRSVNWRASARRNELWVNQQHPERNTDVVLFVDSFAEARRGAAGTLDLAVRAAASLAERYGSRRDRVGLVSFGGVLRWLTPGGGVVQLYRIVDSLLDTEIFLSYAWKGIDVVPPRTLPPKALVIALTPLLDERTVGALLDLRARGFDLAVVEVSPVPFVEPGRGEANELAYRIWRLRREALRAEYRAAGVAVSEWQDGQPLAISLQEVAEFRRRAGRLRA